MQTRLALPGNYAVKETLRQDPYSLTLRATDRSDGTDVILKAIRPLHWLSALESDARRMRLQTRLAALQVLECPYLVRTREIAVTAESVILVRDYVHGTSVRTLIDQRARLSVPAATGMAEQIAGALDALAAAGMVHGAVTPDNVFLLGDGSVKLVDPLFRSESRIVPLAGIRCESVRRQHYGCDIEALAALLFEAMSGMPATQSLASSVARAYHLPSQTRYVLMRALSGGRSRFASATELASSLLPSTGASLFRAVWRPAAAAGLLGALATVGGYAYSEKSQTPMVRVAHSPKLEIEPNAAALRLSEDDQYALRLANRRLGAAALSNPAVGQILQLTETQLERTAAILAAQRTRVENLLEKSGSGAGKHVASAMRTIRECNGAALLQILDQSQRAAWDAAQAMPAGAGEPLL